MALALRLGRTLAEVQALTAEETRLWAAFFERRRSDGRA